MTEKEKPSMTKIYGLLTFFIAFIIIWSYVYANIPIDKYVIRNPYYYFLVSLIPGMIIGLLHNIIFLTAEEDIQNWLDYYNPNHYRLDRILTTTFATALTGFMALGVLMIIKRLLLVDPLEHPGIEFLGILVGGAIVIWYTQRYKSNIH